MQTITAKIQFLLITRRFFMDEKTYKIIGTGGVTALILGICILTGGIAAGILLIINGAKLLKSKTKIIF